MSKRSDTRGGGGEGLERGGFILTYSKLYKSKKREVVAAAQTPYEPFLRAKGYVTI